MVHFLRSYAAFLEVEGDTLAAQFVRENRGPAHVQIVPIQAHRSWKAIAMATLAILLMIGGGVYIYDPTLVGTVVGPAEQIVATFTPAPTPPEAPVQPPPPIPATPPRADDSGSSVLQPEANETDLSQPRLVATPPEPEPEAVTAVKDPPLSPATPDVAVSTTEQDIPTPPAEEPAAETSDPGQPLQQTPDSGRDDTGAADAPAQHSLTITADEEAWLRVWIDDGQPRDMLLAVGATRTLSAQTGFVITFGNAGGVRLTLNGEELPAVGKSGQVVRGFKLPSDR
jgi:cytoskeleton protein RodZ